MKWWNDLWLNESFATFLEPKMVSELFPSWNVLADFLQQLTADALLADSLSSTHPIDVRVDSPDQISQIFDEVSYGKGASVLRMMEAYLGEEAFRKGVSSYLKRYSYGNAEGKDLWRHLGEASDKPVEAMMEAWIRKPGYPVIDVSYDKQRDSLLLRQRRFLLDGRQLDEGDEGNSLWPIPLTMKVNGQLRKHSMGERSQEVNVGGDLRQLKLNEDQTGFYRVQYDDSLYDLIARNFNELSSFDRWGILTDLFAFLMAGTAQLETYFGFIRKCFGETDYPLASSISDQLRALHFIAPSSPSVRQVYSQFFETQIQRLGLEADGRKIESSNSGARQPTETEETDSILRGKILQALALIDHSISKDLAKKFPNYERTDPNIRAAVAIAFARHNEGDRAFGEMVSVMKKIGSESDIININAGLTSFRNPELVQRALDFSLGGEISRADSVYTIGSACANPEAGEITWRWTCQNLDKIRETFAGTYIVSSILQDVISSAGLGREEEVRDYLSRVQIREATAGISKGLELLGIYTRLRSRIGRL